MAAKEMRQAMMEKLGTREYRIRLTEDPRGALWHRSRSCQGA